jgi:hypothetical protein
VVKHQARRFWRWRWGSLVGQFLDESASIGAGQIAGVVVIWLGTGFG